jgi:SAM-dependent methyltransferase
VSGASFRALAREAAARYPARDRYARRFAYGKLAGDPVFEHIVSSRLIASNARILDLGCGQGLVGALLAAGGRHGEAFYRGIDRAERDIERARIAAGPNAELVVADVRSAHLGTADVVILLDVLHYIQPAEQVDLLKRARAALAPGGSILMRVADASGGLRFRVTEAIDLAATRLRGHRIARLYNLPLAERKVQLEREGLRVDCMPMSAGTPFANVLLTARYDSSNP